MLERLQVGWAETTEDKMVGRHNNNGHECDQSSEVGDEWKKQHLQSGSKLDTTEAN